MSFNVQNFMNNPNMVVTEQKGCFSIIEYKKDISVHPYAAQTAYFMSVMNVRQRQALCNIKQGGVALQAGAMQWMVGDINVSTGIKGAGDLLSKGLKSKATGESAIKPEYTGQGVVMLEPTYKYLLLEDVSEWGGGMVIEDGAFLASELSVRHEIVRRKNLSSAVAGGEGLFNLCLAGQGIAVLESPLPRNELIEIVLNNDVLKIDGSMAVAWSKSLDFSVEKTTKSFIGSAASGEGLVNVYRGSGKVLMAPLQPKRMPSGISL